MTAPLTPLESTYRLQFHKNFTFADATAIIPYLAQLGITHVYASPYLKAAPGSTHGYDVIDHCTLNPEIGTTEDFNTFVATLHQHGMGHILDIVPNHVGVATNENVWWNDVLENGRGSHYANYFDINWDGSPLPELHGKVLLPLLGDTYGKVLEKGELKLSFDHGGFWINYHQRRFPVAPATYSVILNPGLDQLRQHLGDGGADVVDEVEALLGLSGGSEMKLRLAALADRSQAVRAFVQQAVDRLNGKPSEPASFNALDDLLNHQHYRLAYWRVAGQEINYRRFFDINDLAALRMDRYDVFRATHDFVLGMVNAGQIQGLRVDHPDGLLDPQVYLQRLQRHGAAYVVVEKILEADESLPRGWPTAGTTGYDFLAKINALLIKADNEPAFSRLYRDFTGNTTPYEQWVYRNKKRVLQGPLASDLNMLSQRVSRLAQTNRLWRDFTFEGLRTALMELIACFPVYRTYVSPRGTSEADRRYFDQAEAASKAADSSIDNSTFQFLRSILLEPASAEQLFLAGKFQQLTAPTTAKGIEDSTFYIFNRLACLNEVGGDPGRFGIEPAAVHEYLQDRQQHWPTGLSPLSTHDTKRSEDVRARMAVLSEMPDQWAAALQRWSKMNQPLARSAGESAIDANEQYLLYQTLLGAWPAAGLADDAARQSFIKRIQAYMLKAIREAKQRTSWTDPNEAHEKAVTSFVAAVLDPKQSAEFQADLHPLQQRIAQLGIWNSLSQTLLRLTAPGVPDTYQGTELLDLSLVDPDNRRPVDYAHRRDLLNQLRGNEGGSSPATADADRLKLRLTHLALLARRHNPGLFTLGSYEPLQFSGPRAAHLFGFIRRYQDRTAAAIVTRLPATLLGGKTQPPVGHEVWGDTAVRWPSSNAAALKDVFSNQTVTATGEVRIADLLAQLPVAFAITP